MKSPCSPSICKKRIFYLLSTGVVLFFLILPLRVADACGPREHKFDGYAFLDFEPFNLQDADAPFVEDFSTIYQKFFKEEEVLKYEDNLSEWGERFCGEVTRSDLEFIIYRASITDLELLKTSVRSKNLPLPQRLVGNTFAEFMLEYKCMETIDYLIFAKECEPYVIATDAWANVEKDFNTMRRLVTRGRKELMRAESPYIRLRYTYQIVRLAHYAKDYDLALETYDFAMPKVDKEVSRMEESFLPWWIMGHRAGALMGLGRHVEASYLYSRIFENCPSRQHSAYRSFFIKNEEDWKACLLLCRNDAERANLYTLRANQKEARALEDMRAIYQLEPQNENLEVLLVKEMKMLEKNLLGLEFNNNARRNKRYHNIPHPGIENYLIEFQAFVRKVREEKRVERPELWHLAEGYCHMLAGDFYAARKSFEALSYRTGEEAMEEQLRVFNLALKINEYKKLNYQAENDLYNILQYDKVYKSDSDFPDFLRDKLNYLFKKQNRPGKAFLTQYTFDDLKPNPDEMILRDLILSAEDEDQSKLERFLLTDHEGNSLLYVLYDLQATQLMNEYEMEAAFEAYKDIPRTRWDEFGVYQPFKEVLDDCVNCPRVMDSIDMYNKGEMLERVNDLMYKSRGELENNAPFFYELGLVFYNTSYFGFAWQVRDHFRSGSTWPQLHRVEGNVFPHWKYPADNKEQTDVEKALYYFEKARLLSLNPELTARATFMAARCEQKMYFMSADYQPEACCNRIPDPPESYLTNFKRLKEGLSETKFYQEIIQECKYFNAYVSRP